MLHLLIQKTRDKMESRRWWRGVGHSVGQRENDSLKIYSCGLMFLSEATRLV